jgi:hypothetical protein
MTQRKRRIEMASVLLALAAIATPVATQAASVIATTTAGCAWTQQPVTLAPNMHGGWLNAVSVASPTMAWGVGYYYNNTSTGKTNGSLIEKWNGGSGWTVVGTGGGAFSSLSAVTSFGVSDAWAVGYIVTTKALAQAMVTQWNGSTWKRTVLPLPTSKATQVYLSSVSGSSASDVWATGSYFTGPETNPGKPFPLIEHYNGKAWSRVTISGVDLSNGNAAIGVLDITSKDVWVIGSRLARYNGSAWTLNAAKPPYGASILVGSSDSDLWVTAPYGSVSYHWNGMAWTQLGTANPYVTLLGVAEGPSRATLWSVGSVFNNPSTNPYIADNGVQVTTPAVSGDLYGVGTGFRLAFAVGNISGQPLVLASCG